MNRGINPWLEERKDEYMRDLIAEFFNCKLAFDAQLEEYQKRGKIKWDALERFVGTAENKGELWKFKDLCHSLLDRPVARITHNIAFERAIHLIFHNLMSLKEHVYVNQEFEDVLKKRYPKGDVELSRALQDFKQLMDRMREEIPEELAMAKKLFEVAAELLRSFLPELKENALVVRYLIENPQIIEKVYGKGSAEEIISSLFPEGKEEAYMITANWYKINGNYQKALRYVDKALQINPHHKKAKKLKEELTTRM